MVRFWLKKRRSVKAGWKLFKKLFKHFIILQPMQKEK